MRNYFVVKPSYNVMLGKMKKKQTINWMSRRLFDWNIGKSFLWRAKTNFGILLPKLFWPTVRKNCSSDWEKTFEIRGWRLRICKTFKITRTIYSHSEMLVQFWKQNAFLTYSWRFLRSNILEQSRLKLEKIIWIQKSAGKVRKA